MAGKRMLHKNICTSEKLAKVSDGAEALYYHIMTLTDDYGRYFANPYILKDTCYPMRDISTDEIRRRLEELAMVRGSDPKDKDGLITFYESNKVLYLEIVRFSEFQLLRSDRPKFSEFPKPKPKKEGHCDAGIPNDNQVATIDIPLTYHCPSSGSHKVEDEVEDEVEERECAGRSAPHARNSFVKPTLPEIKDYCVERRNYVNPEQFFNYYEANGWKVGRNPMKDWRAAVRKWESSDNSKNQRNLPPPIPKAITKEEPTTPMPEEVRMALSGLRMKGV